MPITTETIDTHTQRYREQLARVGELPYEKQATAVGWLTGALAALELLREEATGEKREVGDEE